MGRCIHEWARRPPRGAQGYDLNGNDNANGNGNGAPRHDRALALTAVAASPEKAIVPAAEAKERRVVKASEVIPLDDNDIEDF